MQALKNTVSRIDYLFKKNFYAQKRFEAASNQVQKKALKKWLRDYAEERALLTKELRAELAKIGSFNQYADSISHSVPSSKMKSSKTTAKSIIEGCLHIEEGLIDGYDKIINTFLPERTSSMLKRHQNRIQNRIRQLKKMLLLYPAAAEMEQQVAR